uniref:WD repeat domain phosphoinositide-interacting protein 4 n=1 Tax=Parascaris univalens TaxID=6257 RepID=A0A914ZJW8_PARUN
MRCAVRCINFNDEQNCFAVATDSGLRVFNCDPLAELRNYSLSQVGSVALCVLLHRSNLIAIVAGGSHPKFAENTVMIWDDASKRFVLEFTVNGPVLNVLLSYTRLVVVQARRVHVFEFPNDCKLIRTEETTYNPLGLAALSADTKSEFLVFPGHKIGSVQLVNLQSLTVASSPSPLTINAHQSEVVRLALNNQATLLATGSAKGTVIRVFDTRTRNILSEFRRGADPANLHCLRFSPCSSFLAVSSDKGTIHIFTVRDKGDDKWSNKKTIFQQVGLITEEARRSCAQFSLRDSEQVAEVAFISSSSSTNMGGEAAATLKSRQSVVAICTDGTYHRFVFTADGACSREESRRVSFRDEKFASP